MQRLWYTGDRASGRHMSPDTDGSGWRLSPIAVFDDR
ncbi:hypothetical protein MY11210_009483, partial [Beauveria gryllotalpidicola]